MFDYFSSFRNVVESVPDLKHWLQRDISNDSFNELVDDSGDVICPHLHLDIKANINELMRLKGSRFFKALLCKNVEIQNDATQKSHAKAIVQSLETYNETVQHLSNGKIYSSATV